MQRYVLLKKQWSQDGCSIPRIAPVLNAEPTREKIEALKERAINCIGTYTPTEAKLRVDAYLLRSICNLALKVKPKRFKLKVKHEKGNNKNSNRDSQKIR